jgi:DNA-binding MarR family transcriptional regulator
MSQTPLTQRDYVLLETLFSFGLMTTPQLERKVFSRIRRTTVLRRLRKLGKRGLIQRTSGSEKGALVWSVTAKGGALIGEPSGYGHINRNTLEHDILVSEVRLVLEEIGVSREWKPGHILKKEVSPGRRESGLIPDGIMLLPLGDSFRAVAIELELSAKAHSRYTKVIREYAGKRSIAAVWYIVSHKSIGKSVFKAAASPNSSDRKGEWVFWTPLSEMLKDPLQAQLRGMSKTISLKDLAQPPALGVIKPVEVVSPALFC